MSLSTEDADAVLTVLDRGLAQPAPTRVERRVIAAADTFVTVYRDDVSGPGGASATLVTIEERQGLPGAAVLACVDGAVVLVLTYRHQVGTWEWGIPRGFAQGPDTRSTARAELLEETGLEAESIDLLGSLTPNSGLLSSRVDVYWTDDVDVAGEPDPSEVAAVAHVPVGMLASVLASGRVRDGFTLGALALARAQRRLAW